MAPVAHCRWPASSALTNSAATPSARAISGPRTGPAAHSAVAQPSAVIASPAATVTEPSAPLAGAPPGRPGPAAP